MRNLILAGAAALAFTAAPAIGQDVAVDAEGNVYVLTDAQQTMYEGWPADRRTMYDAWPMGVQEYYWTLTPMQTEGWWVLTDPQRVRIYEMTPQQRTAAWQQIAAQMNTSATARTAARASSTMAPRFVRNEVVQATPGDAATASSATDLPVCTPNQQDGCINSWEKNRTGTRPLNYWPGRPASEIPGSLPADDPNS